MLVTHPDHYNGLTHLVAGLDVPVVALPGVDQGIHEQDDARRAQWAPMFGDEWQPNPTLPTDGGSTPTTN